VQLRLTRRADYAVRAVLALAEADGLLTTEELARLMEMPSGFLPQIMPALVRDGILERRLGRHGGYRLARPASGISLLDVIDAAEGRMPMRSCVLRAGACRRDVPCVVHATVVNGERAQRRAFAIVDFGSLVGPFRAGSSRPPPHAGVVMRRDERHDPAAERELNAGDEGR
jgi:Rrf2 family protein